MKRFRSYLSGPEDAVSSQRRFFTLHQVSHLAMQHGICPVALHHHKMQCPHSAKTALVTAQHLSARSATCRMTHSSRSKIGFASPTPVWRLLRTPAW